MDRHDGSEHECTFRKRESESHKWVPECTLGRYSVFPELERRAIGEIDRGTTRDKLRQNLTSTLMDVFAPAYQAPRHKLSVTPTTVYQLEVLSCVNNQALPSRIVFVCVSTQHDAKDRWSQPGKIEADETAGPWDIQNWDFLCVTSTGNTPSRCNIVLNGEHN